MGYDALACHIWIVRDDALAEVDGGRGEGAVYIHLGFGGQLAFEVLALYQAYA